MSLIRQVKMLCQWTYLIFNTHLPMIGKKKKRDHAKRGLPGSNTIFCHLFKKKCHFRLHSRLSDIVITKSKKMSRLKLSCVCEAGADDDAIKRLLKLWFLNPYRIKRYMLPAF